MHPARARSERARSELLSSLPRGFDTDGDGFAGAEAAWLEVLADDFPSGVGRGNAEVKEAWSGFYGRVRAASRSRPNRPSRGHPWQFGEWACTWATHPGRVAPYAPPRAYNERSVGDREVATVESGPQAAIARQEAMVDDLRKAELVRDRLEGLRQSARAYPEGHDIRVLIERLPVDGALRAVEENIRTLREALLYPRGT